MAATGKLPVRGAGGGGSQHANAEVQPPCCYCAEVVVVPKRLGALWAGFLHAQVRRASMPHPTGLHARTVRRVAVWAAAHPLGATLRACTDTRAAAAQHNRINGCAGHGWVGGWLGGWVGGAARALRPCRPGTHSTAPAAALARAAWASLAASCTRARARAAQPFVQASEAGG